MILDDDDDGGDVVLVASSDLWCPAAVEAEHLLDYLTAFRNTTSVTNNLSITAN